MEILEDILEIKFEGNEVSPSTVNPSEIAQIVSDFEDILLSQINQDYPEVDIANIVLFTFEQIKNESLGIPFNKKVFKVFSKDVVGETFKKITEAISTDDYTSLSDKSILGLKSISRFTKKHRCNGHFKSNNEIVTTITPNTEIKENKPVVLKGNTTIYGEIVDVGKNIHVKLNNGNIVLIDADKIVSKKLGSRLWEYVGFRGIAKWDALTFKIVEFRLTEILDYTSGNVANTFAELRGISSAWNNYNSNEEINKQLLRD